MDPKRVEEIVADAVDFENEQRWNIRKPGVIEAFNAETAIRRAISLAVPDDCVVVKRDRVLAWETAINGRPTQQDIELTIDDMDSVIMAVDEDVDRTCQGMTYRGAMEYAIRSAYRLGLDAALKADQEEEDR